MSDVDLMVIGSVGLSDLSPVLRGMEKKFKREFNVKCYAPEEFKRKIEARNHFLTSVMEKDKVFLKGNEDELESLAGEMDRVAA